jgi:hypothetical protein
MTAIGTEAQARLVRSWNLLSQRPPDLRPLNQQFSMAAENQYRGLQRELTS